MTDAMNAHISTEKALRSKGVERLKNLTHSATELFLEHGYDATSMDMLINRVGGSRRNIYERFGGKEGLFVAVISEECKTLAAPLEALVLSNQCVKQTLQNFAEEILHIIQQPRTLELHRLMIAEGKRFPHLSQAIWAAGQDNAKLILEHWIEQQQALGTLSSNFSASLLAQSFIQLVVPPIQMQMLIGGTTISVEQNLDIIHHAVDFFLTATTQDIKNVKGKY
ncbi:TetR/AcrR family transcriptional regulator [Acinetobacter puyangensis]|uniref:Transcriptional regulator, TetR family n=1 Tax=Acinetobacter puyangensis TaxID=1096779 RepID=A0A240EAC8_9GAMM|nr:TetR/AcrR family transcriptional regulator [Acinetobacter puyangensis]SNX45664.1 transcriptional regulator, TetR family [Acinetobacter puyangensis]